MHAQTVSELTHSHVFLSPTHERNERRTWWVVGLTAAMMVGEIIAGVVFNSMALLADGWHMATHAGALGVSALAYRLARRHVRDSRFTFGTGKVGDLAGFASAFALGMTALLIAWEAVGRLLNPVVIAFDQAIAVAVLGLVVNLEAVMYWPHSGFFETPGGGLGRAPAEDPSVLRIRADPRSALLRQALSIVCRVAVRGGQE